MRPEVIKVSRNGDHYFSVNPRASHDVREIREEIRGVTLTLLTDAGVFAKEKVDRGTRLLLQAVPLPERGPILDLGCGYGPIGITLAKLLPDALVYMSDPNRRAVDSAEETHSGTAPPMSISSRGKATRLLRKGCSFRRS